MEWEPFIKLLELNKAKNALVIGCGIIAKKEIIREEQYVFMVAVYR